MILQNEGLIKSATFPSFLELTNESDHNQHSDMMCS